MPHSLSDQNECFSLHCGVNAQCLLNAGNPTCSCQEGFIGDGQLCVGEYIFICVFRGMKLHL